jgi:hypothetical protein
MAKVTAAISEGKITPTEGEALSNILTAHKDVLVAEDLERRVGDLERRMSSDGMGHNQGGGLAIRGQRSEQTRTLRNAWSVLNSAWVLLRRRSHIRSEPKHLPLSAERN